MKRIGILASGNGSNAENLIAFFSSSSIARVNAVIADRPNARALERAKKWGVTTRLIPRKKLLAEPPDYTLKGLPQFDLVILAGFLGLLPKAYIDYFQEQVINLHPALLPHYAGKGMYGDYVHKAVIKNKELRSGITIHRVNEKYDDGQILFQAQCLITPAETVESLALRIHRLEHYYLPRVTHNLLANNDTALYPISMLGALN